MTHAEQIAERYHNDGQCWTVDGIRLEDALREAGARPVGDGADTTRWTLPDGSVITTAGGGWDFGYHDCFCWRGAGHAEGCQSACAE